VIRLACVLHAHLPWASPEDPVGSRWLGEAVVESLVPLLGLLERRAGTGPGLQLTLGVTPPLAAMLEDPRHRDGVTRFLAARREVLARVAEVAPPEARPALEDQARRESAVAMDWEACGGALVPRVRRLVEAGSIEPLASALTHPILPLLPAPWAAVQVGLGLDAAAGIFGRAPDAFWLPECAVDPATARLLDDAGMRATVVEPHAIGGARLAAGRRLRLLARDPEAARQVWDPVHGFPAHPDHRERWRDVGFDLPRGLLAPLLGPDEPRRRVGIGWHRISGTPDLGAKAFYDPPRAARRARDQAAAFVRARVEGPRDAVAAFDAELFGHFWTEGPGFLEAMLQEVAATPGIRMASLAELAGEPAPRGRPAPTSWGRGGDFSTWVDAGTASMQAALLAAAARAMGATAARELLLAQASDWTFQVTRSTAPEYGAARLRDHLERFHRLAPATAENRDEQASGFPTFAPERLAWLERGGHPGRPGPGHGRRGPGH